MGRKKKYCKNEGEETKEVIEHAHSKHTEENKT